MALAHFSSVFLNETKWISDENACRGGHYFTQQDLIGFWKVFLYDSQSEGRADKKWKSSFRGG